MEKLHNKTRVFFKLNNGTEITSLFEGDINSTIRQLDIMNSEFGIFSLAGKNFTVNDVKLHTLQDKDEYLEYKVVDGSFDLVYEYNTNESNKAIEELLKQAKDGKLDLTIN